jgi:hypothetical protein
MPIVRKRTYHPMLEGEIQENPVTACRAINHQMGTNGGVAHPAAALAACLEEGGYRLGGRPKGVNRQCAQHGKPQGNGGGLKPGQAAVFASTNLEFANANIVLSISNELNAIYSVAGFASIR